VLFYFYFCPLFFAFFLETALQAIDFSETKQQAQYLVDIIIDASQLSDLGYKFLSLNVIFVLVALLF
jgi:hypothetical protein